MIVALLLALQPEHVEVPGSKRFIRLERIEGGTLEVGGRKIAVPPFRMAACEIAWDQLLPFREEFKALDRDDFDYLEWTIPKRFFEGERPAVGVHWHLAVHYCAWLSEKTGGYFRLPTEAEWELALRAGGDLPAPDDDRVWHARNAPDGPQPVGRKKPNAFGLHDMLGNAWELVLEPSPLPDYGPVFRGGAWNVAPEPRLGAVRQGIDEDWVDHDPHRPRSQRWLIGLKASQGFRPVRVAGPDDCLERANYRRHIHVGIASVEALQMFRVGGLAFRFTRVRGEISNTGARTVDDVEIDVHAVDEEGRPHRMDKEGTYGNATWTRSWPVLSSGILPGLHAAPLRPGERRAFEALYPSPLDDVAEKQAGVRVTNLRFVP